MIYKRHLENVSKSSESNDILEAEEQMRSPLSLLSTLDELDQVYNHCMVISRNIL
jgi:hypothetical protein